MSRIVDKNRKCCKNAVDQAVSVEAETINFSKQKPFMKTSRGKAYHTRWRERASTGAKEISVTGISDRVVACTPTTLSDNVLLTSWGWAAQSHIHTPFLLVFIAVSLHLSSSIHLAGQGCRVKSCKLSPLHPLSDVVLKFQQVSSTLLSPTLILLYADDPGQRVIYRLIHGKKL